jgi:hypothetical protein
MEDKIYEKFNELNLEFVRQHDFIEFIPNEVFYKRCDELIYYAEQKNDLLFFWTNYKIRGYFIDYFKIYMRSKKIATLI